MSDDNREFLFTCSCGEEFARLDRDTGVLLITSRHGTHRHTNTIAVDILVKMLYGGDAAVIKLADILKPEEVIEVRPVA